MIDAQAIDEPFAGELVDVEKAPVIDVVGGHAEIRRTPVLRLNQRVEIAPGLRVSGYSAESIDRLADRRAHVFMRGRRTRELHFQVRRPLRLLRTPLRQIRKRVAQPLQLRMRIAQNARVVQRADRQLVRSVSPHGERSGLLLESQLELARVQLDSVLVSQKGRQQLVAKISSLRLPIDIEPAGVRRIRTPLEHVQPVRIVRAAHTHVVGHEIQNLAEAVFTQRRDHALECRRIAELGMKRVVVHDVVAVGAAGARFQPGRAVDMTDAETRKIRRDARHLVEAEALAKLHAISGAGNHRDQRTVQAPKQPSGAASPSCQMMC